MSKSVLVFKDYYKDLGVRSKGEYIHETFVGFNISSSECIVEKRHGCGCFRLPVERLRVPPKGRVEIPATFNVKQESGVDVRQAFFTVWQKGAVVDRFKVIVGATVH